MNLVENFKFTIDKEKNIEIQFELFLNKIYDGESYDILDNNFIIDLSNKSTKEVYYYGLDFFGNDYKKCVEVLKTILDKFPYAGMIIGLAYKGLEKPELSNQYLKKFYKKANELEGCKKDLWGGSDSIGGSPYSGTLLKQSDLKQIALECQ